MENINKQSAAEIVNEVANATENTAANQEVTTTEEKAKTKITKEEKKAIQAEKKAERKAKFDKMLRDGALIRRNIPDVEFSGFTRIKAQQITDDNRKYLEPYTVALMQNKIESKFFKPEDGEIYYLTKKFFAAKFGTPDAEIVIKDLIGFINQRFYYITTPSHEEKNLKIRFKCHKFRTAYYKAKTIDFLQEKENPLKEAAWIAVHSFMTGIFLNPERVFRLIPRGNDKLIPKWNEYVSQIDDVPEEVLNIFMFGDGGICPYLEAHKELFRKDDAPADDAPFDEASDVKGHTVDVSSPEEDDAAKKSAELDEQYRNAMANDKEPKQKDDAKDKEKVVSFGQLKKDARKNVTNPATVAEKIVTPTPAITPKEEEKVEPLAPTGNITVDGMSVDIDFPSNNQAWELSIPRLDKFTRVVNKLGYRVAYAQHPGYPGLVRAIIVDKDNKIINILTIDPCLIYGDTLRIVTNDTDDIRKECFIPISQENVVVKAIKKCLTKADKKAMTEKLPFGFEFKDGEYSIIDRVDLRGLMNGGKNGLPFDQWKELINNINTAISNIPNVRFRIVDFESPKKFKLVCDENVLAAFNTPIFREQNHITAMQQNLFIPVEK